MPNYSADTLVANIKSKGYWTISFSPLKSDVSSSLSILDCKKILSESPVHLRGWPYPSTRNSETDTPVSFGDYVESKIDWEEMKEVCRLYKSQKFVHLFGVREDWYDDESLRAFYKIPEGETKILSTVSTVYQFTEILQFLLSLTKLGLYKDGVELEIGLHNTDNRILVTDRGRGRLFQDYRCHPKEFFLSKRLEVDQINTEANKIAVELMAEFFSYFNWDHSPRGVFEEDQRKLLSRQI